jgi:hypothetical protein
VYFVFLEFLQPRVEGTLRELRDALQPWKQSKSPVHVTVRGPYRTEPDYEHLRTLASGVKGRGVRIIGAGYFAHGQTFSVFLRAESAVFRELWWKPDFPARSGDIQPHVTIFESTDRESALQVLNFLKAARISIHTTSVQLSVFASGQPDLFGTRPVDEVPPNAHLRRDIVAIDDDVLPRARELGERLHARRNELLRTSRGDA